MPDHCPECGAFVQTGSKEVEGRHPETLRTVRFGLTARRCSACGWRYLEPYVAGCKRMHLEPILFRQF